MLWKVNPRFGDTSLTDALNPVSVARNAGAQVVSLDTSLYNDLQSAYGWAVAPVDPLAAASSLEQGTGNLLYNAASGNLTQNQVDAIKAQTNAAISQAAGGNTDLATQEQQQAADELNQVVASGTYTGAGNLLSDVTTAASGVAAGTSGVIAWIESNSVLLFAAAAAFLIFRPDKAFSRR